MSAPKGGRFVHGFETKYTTEVLLNGDTLLTVPTNSILSVTAKFTIAESLMVKSIPASRLRLQVEKKKLGTLICCNWLAFNAKCFNLR